METKVLPYRQQVIVNALQGGTLSWTNLRLAYYGPERAKSPASTSFTMQLRRMMDKKLISKTAMGYELNRGA